MTLKAPFCSTNMQIKSKPLRRQGETSRLSPALSRGSLKKDQRVGSLKFMQLAPGITLQNGSILFENE